MKYLAIIILPIAAYCTAAFGQSAPPISVTPDMTAGEQFVASSSGRAWATLELRSEATVVGEDATLKQICRWMPRDNVVFAQIADLTIVRIPAGTPFRKVSLEEIRKMLGDAGVNLALVNFSGAVECTVTRSDSGVDSHDALQDWIAAQHPATRPAAAAAASSMANTADAQPAAYRQAPLDAPRTLGAILTANVCQKLSIAPDAIRMTFKPEDEKTLDLSEPIFKFDIRAARVFDLGPVAWDVTIVTDAGRHDVTINAVARAWQTHVVVARPLGAQQLLSKDDFTVEQVLADSTPADPLLTLDQCVGQQAARDLKPEMVMTARMVDPTPLVRNGQVVTVTLTRGSVTIRTVAIAMETGGMGQTIKVRNDTTRDVYDAVVIGPQSVSIGPDASK